MIAPGRLLFVSLEILPGGAPTWTQWLEAAPSSDWSEDDSAHVFVRSADAAILNLSLLDSMEREHALELREVRRASGAWTHLRFGRGDATPVVAPQWCLEIPAELQTPLELTGPVMGQVAEQAGFLEASGKIVLRERTLDDGRMALEEGLFAANDSDWGDAAHREVCLMRMTRRTSTAKSRIVLGRADLRFGLRLSRGRRGRMAIDKIVLSKGSAVQLAIAEAPSGSIAVQIRASWEMAPSHVRAFSTNYSVRAGKRYAVAFQARAERPRPLSLDVVQDKAPWSTLRASWCHFRPVELTPDWRPYYFEFTSNADDPSAALAFVVGGSPIPVWISDARIRLIREPGL